MDGRQNVFTLLSAAMQGHADEDAFGGRLRSGKLKSRLLEAHPPEWSDDGVATLIEERATAAGLRVSQLDEGLWVLLGDDAVFFLDALNPRFWLLHTTAPADVLRRLVRRELLTDARLDSAWMPRHQLTLDGEHHWLQSTFESDALVPATEAGDHRTRKWRVQVEGEFPEELLALAAENPKYAAATALTAVGSVLSESGVGEARLLADYRGAFIASGNSFELVAGALWRTMDRYRGYVLRLEQLHRLRASPMEDTGLVVDGDVAIIDFPLDVPDLGHFVGALFNAKEPFRLWAVPRQVGPSQWEANAVDLHVGETLRLEITPRWMRVLLDDATCGNTIARLLANLQHGFHAHTRLDTDLQLVA